MALVLLKGELMHDLNFDNVMKMFDIWESMLEDPTVQEQVDETLKSDKVIDGIIQDIGDDKDAS